MTLSVNLENIMERIINLDESARDLVKEALLKGVDPYVIIDKCVLEAGKKLGKLFDEGTYALPELMLAADILVDIVKIIEEYLKERKLEVKEIGTVVIATVKGDIHDIGKNLVATMLRVNGFRVYDLGRDVPSLDIINKAVEVGADIIGLSALMTTSMSYQKEVIDLLKELGIRDRFFVIVGGGSVTKEWADKIGADGYGENALEAVELAKNLMKKKASKQA
ncbi:MAG: corrinoid protein [Saccharolobus sp.]|uniref:cobalamin B12-binding domain-containing protein n=1 Tax=Saccharolobus sp. TaxID=2100761 RepID=UPI0031613C20